MSKAIDMTWSFDDDGLYFYEPESAMATMIDEPAHAGYEGAKISQETQNLIREIEALPDFAKRKIYDLVDAFNRMKNEGSK